MELKRVCVFLLGSVLPWAALADKPVAGPADSPSGFFKSLMPADSAATGSPLLNRGDVAALMAPGDPIADWMQSRARATEPAGGGLDPRRPGATPVFGRLDWRASGGVEGLIQGYNALGDSIKSRIFGESLSRNLEIEIDGSPEIKYRVEFD